MSKLNVLVVVFALFAIVFNSSCSKDDENEELSVNQSDIIGTWESTGGDDFSECPNGDNKLFVISETEIKEGQTNSDGCQIKDSYATMSYEYKNGNTLDAGIGAYKITSFNDNTMTFEMSTPLVPGQTSTVELVKK